MLFLTCPSRGFVGIVPWVRSSLAVPPARGDHLGGDRAFEDNPPRSSRSCRVLTVPHRRTIPCSSGFSRPQLSLDVVASAPTLETQTSLALASA